MVSANRVAVGLLADIAVPTDVSGHPRVERISGVPGDILVALRPLRTSVGGAFR